MPHSQTSKTLISDEAQSSPVHARRALLVAGLAGGAAFLSSANGSKAAAVNDDGPGTAPRASDAFSAGAIRAGRGSQLQGRVAVVTGAARGIGRAIAVEYAANGADVVALDIAGPVSRVADAVPASHEELDETVRQIQSFGRRAMAIRADIRQIAQLRAAADEVVRAFGHIDILVANAAIQGWKSLLDMDDADWDDQIENNLNGTARTLRAFVPHMITRQGGRVLIVSSMQGRHGTKGGASYSASKWGLIGLMKSAAMEFAPYGMTVNAIIPGLVGTALTLNQQRLAALEQQVHHTVHGEISPAQAWKDRARTEVQPVGWLQPEDISPIAVFLASDASALTTGAEFEVNGGDSALMT
ncbi:SDR family NAD(P)-dependent oxidoreductase [Asaia sp. As-1742]|uniref:SDR family NAD(P)-dependent oxidoreductase n=1 Tax=Asaia sp. As-1742 TaxID=2608325 RepID=UPI00141E8615|nr:SDR family NAD(P)-dependent oxidoreductase [Asaia sp. As-1742]NIE79694.1 SDR family NAD(P)-dependent oxidoreductase [Asaia sp. As-1742]